MRQQILTITCDDCGCQQSFETLRCPPDGPMVAARERQVMLARNGWVAIEVTGFMVADVCRDCWREREARSQKGKKTT